VGGYPAGNARVGIQFHFFQLFSDIALGDLKQELLQLDDRIAPLAQAAAKLGHPRWGLTMRAGNDKSHLARQIERYADVYTSRVSNFGLMSPYAYLRAPRSSLPHDPR